MDQFTRETRRESYDKVLEMSAEKRKQQIMEVLKDKPMTADEITQQLLERNLIPYYDRNFVSPRLTELKDQGLIESIGKSYCDRTRRKVTMFRVTENG